jgi:putative hydrolase
MCIEISARRGHCLANGLVARTCLDAGAPLIVDSDGHAPNDLLTEARARSIALGAGIPANLLALVLVENPRRLLAKVHG